MIISNNVTDEFFDDLFKEATRKGIPGWTYYRYDLINTYLKDEYGIYIKSHTTRQGTKYYRTLAFYAQCPDYKRFKRNDFIKKYRKHLLSISISLSLKRALRDEYCRDHSIHMALTSVCMKNNAIHIPNSWAQEDFLLFKDYKRFDLFKLKYSEYL